MFIKTRTDEVIMIATSYFLWKKKPIRVEIFKKKSRICLFYNSALRRRTINPEENKQDFSSDFLIYYCYFWWKSLPHTGCHLWNCCVESIVVVSMPWNPEQLSVMEKTGLLSSKGHLVALFFIDTYSSITNTFDMLWIWIIRCSFLTCCIERNNITFQFFK